MKVYRDQAVEFAQEKMNGHRITILRVDDVKVMGRKRDWTDHLVSHPIIGPKLYHLPPCCSLDCEIWVPGGDPSHVVTAILERDRELEISPFAVRSLSSLPFTHAMRWIRDYTLFYHPKFEYIPSKVREDYDLTGFYCELALRRRIEGFVLKNSHCDENQWYKVKPQFTVDAVVTDVKDGRGKYSGMVGSLEVSVYKNGELVPIANVSGMNDSERESMDDSVIGKVVEVEFQAMLKSRLQFPRFIRFRDDKEPHECDWSQLNEPRTSNA